MVRGLYTAYTGMRNEQRRLDIISNNLANSATIGYKEENVTSRSFKDMMAVKIRDGSVGYRNDEPRRKDWRDLHGLESGESSRDGEYL